MIKPCSFDLLDFSPENFCSAISNPTCPTSEVFKQHPSKYLIDYLSEIGAKTIIVEHKYVDGDYLDDFASYYVRCGKDYSRYCERLHFFSISFDLTLFQNALIGGPPNCEEDLLKGSYLGFIVARPLPAAIIGRTVLKTYGSDSNRRHYPCTKKYKANLYGFELEIESLPYQQQDEVLAACATVALWTCFHKTSEIFGTACPRPATITRIANQVMGEGRPIPSKGLTFQQISYAIRKFDLEPETFKTTASAPSNVPLISLIYSYLEAGLPVILGVLVEGRGYHAISISGYSLLPSQFLSTEVSDGLSCIKMRGLRVNKLYAHDDQFGPFSRLEIKPGGKYIDNGSELYAPVTFEGKWTNHNTSNPSLIIPIVAFVPVYNKIRLTFLDIREWLERLSSFLGSIKIDEKEFEWDLILTTINQYKSQVRENKELDKNQIANRIFQGHPRFIWKASLSIKEKKGLEILADATGVNSDVPFYFLDIFSSDMKKIIKNKIEDPSLQDSLKKHLGEPFLEFLKSHV